MSVNDTSLWLLMHAESGQVIYMHKHTDKHNRLTALCPGTTRAGRYRKKQESYLHAGKLYH